MKPNAKNKIKLTKRSVESAAADPTKRISLWDTEVRGFNVRIYPTGRKVYYFQYRNYQNVTRKAKIGVHGNTSTEQAREKAQQLALEVSAGTDPTAQKKSAKAIPTMADLCHEYMELHSKVNKRKTSQYDDSKMIHKSILPKIGQKRLNEVSVHDVQKIHRSLGKTPYAANRVRSLLSKMFNLAIEWGWHDQNPATKVIKYHEHKRTSWLNKEEITRLLATLEGYPDQAVTTAIRLLLFTGARKSEVLSAKWEQFDLERGVWIKPAASTKQKKEEHLPLSAKTSEMLMRWKESSESKYLFPGRKKGRPLQDIKGAWITIRKKAGLEGIRVHDLRHTYASHLASNGMSLSIVGKLLGHTQAATTQRYAHLADEPLREATELFESKIR